MFFTSNNHIYQLILFFSIFFFQALQAEAQNQTTSETREYYDTDGDIVRKLVISNQHIDKEILYFYDSKKRLTEKKVLKGENIEIEKKEYNDRGNVIKKEYIENGITTSSIIYNYAKNNSLLSEATVNKDGDIETKYYEYDIYGNTTKTISKDDSGKILSKTLSEYAKPSVPIQLSFGAGYSYQSDASLMETTLHGGITRKPPIEAYSADPLEMNLAITYKLSKYEGKVVSHYLTGKLGIDYNFIFPQITPFFLAELERNPQTNLLMDLDILSPGIKYDFMKKKTNMRVDISFAPMWNYRAIRIPSGTETCKPDDTANASFCEESLSKIRISMHFKTKWDDSKRFKIANLLAVRPLLFSDGTNFWKGLSNGLIIKDTLTWELKLSSRLSIKEEFKVTYDQSLKDQGVCTTLNSLLCKGYSISNTTGLSLNLMVKR